MGLFTGFRKWQLALIVLFVLAFFAALATKCHAADSNAPGVTVYGGAAVLRGTTEAVEVDWRWRAPQSADAHWETGLTLIGTSEFRGPQRNQFFVTARYIDGWGPVDIGLGLAYAQNLDVYTPSKAVFSLTVGGHWKNWRFKYAHWSNAGTTENNLGRDLILLGRDL